MKRVVLAWGVLGLLGLSACQGEAPATTAPVPVPSSTTASMASAPPPASTAPAAGLSEGQGEGIRASFLDAFTGDQLSDSKWAYTPGPGRIAVANGELTLSVPGKETAYPYVYTKPIVIPTDGPWAVEWGFSWTNTAGSVSQGVVFSLDYFPPSQLGEAVFSPPYFSAGSDRDMLILDVKDANTKAFAFEAANGKPHVLRVEGDAAGNTVLLYDGKISARFTTKRRPLRFALGGNPPTYGLFNYWPVVKVDYFVSGVLTRPLTPPDPAPTPRPDGGASAASAPAQP